LPQKRRGIFLSWADKKPSGLSTIGPRVEKAESSPLTPPLRLGLRGGGRGRGKGEGLGVGNQLKYPQTTVDKNKKSDGIRGKGNLT